MTDANPHADGGTKTIAWWREACDSLRQSNERLTQSYVEQRELAERSAYQWQAQWEETMRQLIEAQRVLARITELCDIADADADASLARMFDGSKWTAIIPVADVRAAMAEQ